MSQRDRRPMLLGPGEGEVVISRPERWVVIKADLPPLSVTESFFGPGEPGPEPHIHREHADCFYVLEGELQFRLAGGKPIQLGPDAFLLVPPGVVHTFRNPGPGEARFLNFHAPDKGFAAQLRNPEQGFDSFDPPDDGRRPGRAALLGAADDGECIDANATRLVIKAGVGDGIGTLSLTEMTLAPGLWASAPHTHAYTVDSFYVLDGKLSLSLDGDLAQAGPGSYVLVPPGNVHTIPNGSDQAVRVLNLMAPAGFEPSLKELLSTRRRMLMTIVNLMTRIASHYDFEPA